MLERLTKEAVLLIKYSRKVTLVGRHFQGAARLVLPGELVKHAVSEGGKALIKFTTWTPM